MTAVVPDYPCWTEQDIQYFFEEGGDEENFLQRYCAEDTLSRLNVRNIPLLRAALACLSRRLPGAAHGSPNWNGGPLPIVVIGRLDNGLRIQVPKIGLCGKGEQLFVWADVKTLNALEISEGWEAWRGTDEGIPNKLYSVPLELTADGALRCDRKLNTALDRIAEDWRSSALTSDTVEKLEAVRIEIEQGRRVDPPSRCVYPRLIKSVWPETKQQKTRSEALPPEIYTMAIEPPIGTATRWAIGQTSVSVATPHLDCPLGNVVSATSAASPRLGISFLNLKFDGTRERPDTRGAGIYGIFFTPTEKPEAQDLIYVGSFCGTKKDVFAGNASTVRWWTHAASFTMRGPIYIARKTFDLARNLKFTGTLNQIASDAGILTDTGCGAGERRVRFASQNWGTFETAGNSMILNPFHIVYIRLDGNLPPCPRGAAEVNAMITRLIRQAEHDLIRKFLPCCNYQVKWGTNPTTVGVTAFKRAVEAALAAGLASAAADLMRT